MWLKDKHLYSIIVCIHIVLSVPGPHMSSHWHHGTQEEQHGAGGDHGDGVGEVSRSQEQPDHEHLMTSTVKHWALPIKKNNRWKSKFCS